VSACVLVLLALGAAPQPVAAEPQVVYPFGARHSPLTASVAANLKRIAAQGKQTETFAKIGDSNTVNPNFLSCFANPELDVPELEPNHFDREAFSRVSLAAGVGWTAATALAGPLDKELEAISPRYAVVMFGTNDLVARTGDLFSFARSLFAITDRLIAKGAVPILSTIPPRNDSVLADARVAEFNAVIHGIAQGRQVPLMDLERELRALPRHGLGRDGLHLNVYPGGACVFTPAGLRFGHNVRNLLTLEALTRTWRAVAGSAALEPTARNQSGEGTLADPIAVSSLPFVDLRDTSTRGANRLAHYSGCGSSQDEAGNELLYRLTVDKPTPVRIRAISINGADVDVHLMSDASSGRGCVLRNDREIITTLQPGTWWLSLDTFSERAGEYLLVIQ
jgi:lysophospholipase L1-like esterase